MAHHKKKFTPPVKPIKTTFDENVIYEVSIWDGVKETISQFTYKFKAEAFFKRMLETKEKCIVTFRKIENFGYALVSSIIKEWEVV